MTNEEMRRLPEYTLRRREVFTEQEKLGASPDRLEQNQELLQAEARGSTGVVRQFSEARARLAEAQIDLSKAQAQTQKDISQTQTGLSHLAKIVNGFVESMARDRSGGKLN